MNGETNILYLCIYQKLRNKAGLGESISKRYLFRLLGETFHVPKNMRVCVLREMELMGLLKCQKKNGEIVFCKTINLENSGEYYKKLGISELKV